MADDTLSGTDLNRALLARQGLLDRLRLPVVDAVRAIGAIQAQQWSSPPVALFSRLADFTATDLYQALDRRDLVTGILMRRTLHLVSAEEHPAYAAVAEATGVNGWLPADVPVPQRAPELLADLLAFTAVTRTGPELRDFLEEWVTAHPDALPEAALAAQRTYDWRPLRAQPALVHQPVDGVFDPRKPDGYRTAPGRPADLGIGAAWTAVVRRHLRAFGPAGADDVAYWIGAPVAQAKAVLDGMAGEVLTFGEEQGRRVLYDLVDAPRPGAAVGAPVRFLPAFDSAILAYAAKRRARILPDAYRDRVYVKANLRWLPTFLVDGLVAGVWSVKSVRRSATLTVTAFAALPAADRAAVRAEAERLVRFAEPAAAGHHVDLVLP